MPSNLENDLRLVTERRAPPVSKFIYRKKETLRQIDSQTTHAGLSRVYVPLVLLLPILLGCAESGPPSVAVSGLVMLDGHPLEQGAILFTPQQGTPGPKAAAEIVDGVFELERKQGLTIGKFRVHIDRVEKQELDKNGLPIAAEADPSTTIPPRYNRYSQLVIETSTTGDNYFEFDLTTDETETQ